MEKVVSVKNLTKVFGDIIAVSNISFDIFENEVFGLIGPNGSGKTTTQRMLSTILEPSSGKILFHHQKSGVLHHDKIRKTIGYVPQGNCLYGDLTVFENLDLFSKAYDLNREKRLKKIKSLLNRLGLMTKKNALVRTLSGGFAKRTSIAAALVHEPKILFLDETTTGLDPNSRYHLWDLIKELKKESTIILTTHYMDEVEKLCDRVLILSEGKIANIGKTAQILKDYDSKDLNEVMGQVIKNEK